MERKKHEIKFFIDTPIEDINNTLSYNDKHQSSLGFYVYSRDKYICYMDNKIIYRTEYRNIEETTPKQFK